jgi:meso-butanediol dehydrogenase/(S,S)-butanediol dehydrogenase/diacetyl reductase
MAIENKVALVTGAGQGIGRGIALRLAKEGASLMLVDVNPEGIAAVAAEVEALGRKAATFVANIAERDQVYAAIDQAEKELGGFDIIVNNAGIAQVQALADVTPEEVDRIMRINVQGTLWGIQAAAKNSSTVSKTAKSSTPAPLPATTVLLCWGSIPPLNLPFAP